MASSFVTSKANAILTAEFKTATVYGSLHLASPGDTGAVTCEVADAYCYTRPEITFATDADARTISNTSALEYATATGGNWGTITHLGICTCSARGQTVDVAYGSLTAEKAIDAGDQLKFAIGAIDVTIAAGA